MRQPQTITVAQPDATVVEYDPVVRDSKLIRVELPDGPDAVPCVGQRSTFTAVEKVTVQVGPEDRRLVRADELDLHLEAWGLTRDAVVDPDPEPA